MALYGLVAGHFGGEEAARRELLFSSTRTPQSYSIVGVDVESLVGFEGGMFQEV